MAEKYSFARPGRLRYWIFVGVCAALAAGAAVDAKAGDSGSKALEFVRATFGSISKEPLTYLLSEEGRFDRKAPRVVGIFVVPPSDVDRARALTASQINTVLLNAYVHLDVDGNIDSAHFRGTSVHFDDNEQFAKTHVGVELPNLVAELGAARATVLDKKDAASRVPLKSWVNIFGTLSVRDARLYRPMRTDAYSQRDWYEWRVLLRSSDSPRRQYVVTVEPFGGAVVDLTRTTADFELPPAK